MLLGRAEEAEGRSAVVQTVPERLTLAHGDVRPALARRLQDREGDRVAGDDHKCAVLLRRRRESLDVLHGSEEVRLLQEDGGGLVVDRVGEGDRVRDAVRKGDLHKLAPVAGAIGDEGLAAVRMHAAGRNQLPAARRADRQVGGGSHGRGTLVEGRVGNRQAGELRHRGLELEHHLQAALGDLGLVRGVRRQELRPARDRIDDRGHVVVIHPGAEKARLGLGVGVPRSQCREPVVHLGLGLSVRQLERAAEAESLGDVLEEVVDRADADRFEHRAAVLVGGGRIAAHDPPIVVTRPDLPSTPGRGR